MVANNAGVSNLKKQPVSTLLFVCILAAFLFACAGWFDSDGLFIIATGRKISETGMLYTHPFSVVEGLPTIIQQWLWCLNVSTLYDTLGRWGMFLLILLCQLVLALLFYAYLKDDGKRNKLFVFSLCLAIVSLNHYISIRPEVITLILLTAQCLCLKKYISSGKPGLLYIIPLLVLAEINVHASYWILHFILLLPYVIPSLIPKIFPRDGISLSALKKHCVHYIFVFLLSVGALFLNPYGKDGIAYVFLSLKANISALSINELNKTQFFSLYGAGLLAVFTLFVISIIKNKLSGVSFYMLSGLLILLALVYKWFLFFPLILLFLAYGWRETFYNLPVEKLKISRIAKLLAVCIVVLCLILSVKQITECDTAGEDEAAVVSKLAELNVPKDTPLFTGFNIGARMEFEGYTSIYIDARPELYSSIINKTRDMLDEYQILRKGKHLNGDIVPHAMTAVGEILTEYDFEFLIVSPGYERCLYTYLSETDDYLCIYEGEKYCLYQKGE